MKNLIRISKLPVVIFVLFLGISCSDDELAVVDKIIEGGFTGTWNSTTSSGATYNNVGVSSVLKDTDGVFYDGPFFITTKFKPAYGPFDDGNISFKVEKDSILNFYYNDIIPRCEGRFIGKGIVDGDGNFLITFTGNDCDGFHNGTIFLKKPQ